MQQEWTKRQRKGLQKMLERDYLKEKEHRNRKREEKASQRQEKRRKPRRLEIEETWKQELKESADDR